MTIVRSIGNRTLAFISKYSPAFKWGLLAGLLISNLVILTLSYQNSQQAASIASQINDKIAADNIDREGSRLASEKRQLKLKEYIECLARIFAQSSDNDTVVRIESLDGCQYDATVMASLPEDNAVVQSSNPAFPQTEKSQQQTSSGGKGGDSDESEEPPEDRQGLRRIPAVDGLLKFLEETMHGI